MKKQLLLLVMTLLPMVATAQNLMNVAFDTNGPMGECLFPQNADGEIVFSGVVESKYPADTIMGLAKEFLYSISKKYKANTSNMLEGVTKMACDLELKVGKKYISVGVMTPGNIGTWEKAASTVKFSIMLEIRNHKYRYTLSNFITDRYRIPGEGKDQGPSNMIHWQRVNSLQKEKKNRHLIEFENVLYQAEYNAVQDVLKGLQTFANEIVDDF